MGLRRASSANSSIRRVPSTLISRASWSGSANDTEAALWTIVVTCSASSLQRAELSPSRGAVSSPATASTRSGVLPGLGTEQVREHDVDALARGEIVARPNEGDDTAPAALEVARKQLHPDEPGRAGQQYRPVAAAHRPARSVWNADTSRERVCAGVISSST